MPDDSHARDAKARAAEKFYTGHLTSVEKVSIDRKAYKILDAAESIVGVCE